MVGTVITLRTTSFLRQRRRRSTQITVELDDLIFVEHIINSFNLPIIFMQLMSILFPEQSKVVMGSKDFSFIYFIPYQLILAYRAIGGLGIAGVRVLCISFHNVVRGIGAKRLVDCTALVMLMLSVIPGFGGSIESFVSDPQFMICFTLGYKLSATKFPGLKKIQAKLQTLKYGTKPMKPSRLTHTLSSPRYFPALMPWPSGCGQTRRRSGIRQSRGCCSSAGDSPTGM